MKFSTFTLGCKVNQFETRAMENILLSRGHLLVRAGEGSDACIINTCTVTAVSAGKSRKAVRRLKRLEPGALIAVCGCLSQLMPDEIASIGADIIGGSGDRREFVLKLEELYRKTKGDDLSVKGADDAECRMTNFHNDKRQDGFSNAEICISNPKQRKIFEELPCGQTKRISARTRALLKIQDGCDNYCAYCVIPHARGRSRSLPFDSVAEQARLLGEQGFREIVVTGIEISAYGKDLDNNLTLTHALLALSEAASDARIRLGSLDPRIVNDEFCGALRGVPNLCDHFHLSVQSGCDKTLARMGRRYSTDDVLGAISKLRALFPNCGITADLITGFPGETEQEFEKTQQFIRQAAFSDMHIFPFSKRPGTKAADMPNRVGKDTKVERARLASEIQAELSQKFRLSQVGKTLEVLFERKRDGYWVGYSTNYAQVAVMAEKGLGKNSVRSALIKAVDGDALLGELLQIRVY